MTNGAEFPVDGSSDERNFDVRSMRFLGDESCLQSCVCMYVVGTAFICPRYRVMHMQRLMKRDSAFDVFVTDVANIFNRPKLTKN